MAQYPNSTAGGGIWTLEKQRVFQMGGNFPIMDFESIASTTVGPSNQTTITFSNIPQSFNHLQIRVFGRSDGAFTYSSCYVRVNGNSATRYTFHYIYGDGASILTPTGRAAGSDTAWIAQNISGNTSAANTFGAVIVDILDYSNINKYKIMRSLGGFDNNGSGSPVGTISHNSGMYLGSTGSSTEAITSITLLTDGNFKEFSTASLYGIKG